MTSIIGILCKDGVVIGTDGSATFAAGQVPTIEQPTEKISIIDQKIIIAGTGQVGLGQRFCEVVEKFQEAFITTQTKDSNFSPLDYCTKLSGLTINNFKQTFMTTGNYGALMGFVFSKNAYLCEFDITQFQPELKTHNIWFCSMGSAQHITDTFLALMRDVFEVNRPPSLIDGIFYATWALDHAIKVNPGGVNHPIQISIIEKAKDNNYLARMVSDLELDEHKQNIDSAKKALKDFQANHQGNGHDVNLNIPKP